MQQSIAIKHTRQPCISPMRNCSVEIRTPGLSERNIFVRCTRREAHRKLRQVFHAQCKHAPLFQGKTATLLSASISDKTGTWFPAASQRVCVCARICQVEPIVVFDGAALPAKDKTAAQRGAPLLNTKGYPSTYLAMGFANVRAGTQKRRARFWVPARTLANPIAR